MKPIQWYPGHMAKAMRVMEESLGLVDGLIYVLDARCPAASYNPKLAKMAANKPVLYVLNKGDLADGKADALTEIMSARAAAVKLTATSSASARQLRVAVDRLVAQKREAGLKKGYTRTFRFMVVGVPNTGKSTVINLLAGAKRAVTGDKAGVTRGKQWIRLEGCELLDTPGTMPPALGDQRLAARLAFVGSINDDILALDDIALALLAELYENYPERLAERYSITGGEPLEMLEKVCSARGFMVRGGAFDYERGIRAVIDDFRKGKLGRITLDSPEDLRRVLNEQT